MKKIDSNNNSERTTEIIDRSIESFLTTELLETATYIVTSRTAPNIMDGLRIGARKVLHSVLTGKLKSGNEEKMMVLIGEIFANNYSHGDSAMKSTIESLGSKHKFNYNPINVIGQIPTLREPEITTASRYLAVEQNLENMLLFNKDKDLLVANFEEGHHYEPEFYLPIIPVSLLIETTAPGFGFNYKSNQFRIDDVIDATLTALLTKKCSDDYNVQLKPYVDGIKESNFIYNEALDSWYNVGEYKTKDNKLIITDLPWNISDNKYESHLKKLVDQGFILDYLNLSTEGRIHFELTFITPKKLQALMNHKLLFFNKVLLYKKISKSSLNVMDMDGKTLLNFENENKLIEAFVKKRLPFFKKRKALLIKNMSDRIAHLDDLVKFITLVIDEKLIINKRKIADIKLDCLNLGVSYNGLDLKISRLTIEEINKANKEIDTLKKELKVVMNTSEEEMYVTDLIELKEKLGQGIEEIQV